MAEIRPDEPVSIAFDLTDLTVNGTRVLLCTRCKALVPEDVGPHVDWHTQLSLEAWPEYQRPTDE